MEGVDVMTIGSCVGGTDFGGDVGELFAGSNVELVTVGEVVGGVVAEPMKVGELV